MAKTEQTTAAEAPEPGAGGKRRLNPLLRKLLWGGGNLLAGIVICVLFLRWQQPATSTIDKEIEATQTVPVNAAPLFDGQADAAPAAGVPVDGVPVNASPLREPIPSTEEVSAALQGPTGTPLPDPLAAIDSLIAAGRYNIAMPACDRLAETGHWSGSLELMFRRALLMERFRALEDAQHQYMQMLDLGGDERLLAAARLGQARCLLELGRVEAARMLLYSQLLRTGQLTSATGETLHACAQLLGIDVQPAAGNPLDDSVIIHQVSKPDDAQLLKSYRVAADPVAPLADGIHVLDHFNDQPDSIQIESHFAAATVMDVLNHLMKVLEYTTVMDETAMQTFKARSITISVRDMNLAIFLDAMLEPSGYTWSVEAKQLQVRSLSALSRTELQELRIRQAGRICRTALALFPDRPEALATYMVLGNVSFWTGQDSDAVSSYRELERRADGRDPGFAVRFNLGKAYLRLNQRKEAREAFYRVIDTAHGQAIQAVAYAYVGRLFMEDGLPENATRELARGLTFASTPEVRRACIETLAAAYLIEGNAMAANQTLMDNRDVIQEEEPTRSHTAFISALARTRAAAGETDLLRRKRELTASLANVVPSRFFGSMGYYLIGQAFTELELVDQMEAVYGEGIAATQPHVLRTKMMFDVANHIYESGRWSELDKWFTEFEANGTPEGIRWSRLRRAEIAYKSGRYDECLDRCYDAMLIELTDDDKRLILTLMGKIFERRSDYYKAALCFAGMVPTAATEESIQP